MKSSMKDVWKLVAPYWVSKEKYKAFGLFSLTICLSLASVYGAVLLNEWNSGFYNALQALDQAAFKKQCVVFLYIAFFVISVFLLNFYVKYLLVFQWRKWLTEYYIERWLRYHNHYRLRFLKHNTDNPDQRISEDLGSFTGKVISLVTEIFRQSVSFVSFVGILWVLSGPLNLEAFGIPFTIPGYMVWVALIYSLIGTGLVFKIGKPIVKLDFDQERFEANFRYSLVRLREQSEEVAIYRGHKIEEDNFRRSFSYIVQNYYKILKQQLYIGCCQNFYNNLSIIFPFVAAAPLFFTKVITLGILMQMRSAFSEVQSSLSVLLNSFQDIAALRATTQRLTGFYEALNSLEKDDALKKNISGQRIEKQADQQTDQQADQQIDHPAENRTAHQTAHRTAHQTEHQTAHQAEHQNDQQRQNQLHVVPNFKNCLEIENLCLTTPEGQILLNNFNLSAYPSEKILIMGRSGFGKSTLLRAISGLWPFGSGVIHIPTAHFMLFPQRNYNPLGSLRDILLYPGEKCLEQTSFGDSQLKSILADCRLEHLCEQLDTVKDWSRVLSLGEQQRIIFARILVQKPEWIMMDEPTSAMDKETESMMYHILNQHLPHLTIITIGHSHSLKVHHTRILVLDEVQEQRAEGAVEEVSGSIAS